MPVALHRTLALSSLLVVLALTASGCQAAPNANPAAAPTTTGAVTKTPASSLDPAKVELGENWVNLLGNDPALATSAAVVGNKVLNLVYDQFPQNTVGGFKPTQDDFDQVIAAAKPFMSAEAIQNMESEWVSKKSLPTLTSGRTDREGNFSQTYVTEAGESCTDPDKPYDIKPLSNHLITIPDENQVELPAFYSHTEVTVHCKEGGLLQGQMLTWFPLVQENGTWLVGQPLQVKPAKPFEMVS